MTAMSEPSKGDRQTGGEDLSLRLAQDLARGVTRMLVQHGYVCLAEFTLANARRVDVMGLGGGGELLAVEIKTSLADFRADGKWPDYLDYCERFFFAVPADFPQEVLPEGHGLIVADRYAAEILRAAPQRRLHAARKRAVTLQFAQAAARRLDLLVDPR
jgi:hypothetical protein